MDSNGLGNSWDMGEASEIGEARENSSGSFEGAWTGIGRVTEGVAAGVDSSPATNADLTEGATGVSSAGLDVTGSGVTGRSGRSKVMEGARVGEGARTEVVSEAFEFRRPSAKLMREKALPNLGGMAGESRGRVSIVAQQPLSQ